MSSSRGTAGSGSTLAGPDIRIAATVDELSRAAAAEFVEVVTAAVAARDIAAVALAGGSTPRHVYRLLAEDPPLSSRVPWRKIQFFWGDERHVPPDNDQSNYRMASEELLAKVPVRSECVHRVRAENADAAAAALEYEHEVRTTLATKTREIPRFDLILLGMGPDGHTASLFPGTDALAERVRLVVANWVATFQAHRITMTLPLLNAAASVVFLVAGADKAEIVREVLRGGASTSGYPAQLVRPRDGRLTWLLDRAAAQHLHEAV